VKLVDPSIGSLRLQDNEEAFESMFAEWFGNLYNYAFSVLRDAAAAEEVVQQVFCLIWEKRERLQVNTSLKAYLFGCVYHECVNWMRQKKKARTYLLHLSRSGRNDTTDSAHAGIELGELEKRLDKAINELPDRCRAVFFLSRFGQLGYREIAAEMGISVKTVEGQMSKALKHLRKRLADLL
jgi:RNA polymerase sigma-70 factor (ECF subfamily)